MVCVLAFSALMVKAYPFYPYGDKEEEQRNTFVSNDAVAVYFKNEFETEDIKPAMVLEYLINLVGASKTQSKNLGKYY